MRFLNRFPQSKHDQIKQLMAYAELCGLSGPDLISIGGYIDRKRKADNASHLIEIVSSYNIKLSNGQNPRRFSIKNDFGNYQFDSDSYYDRWTIINTKTKQKRSIIPSTQDWPRSLSWNKRAVYDMVLAVHNGEVKLDF